MFISLCLELCTISQRNLVFLIFDMLLYILGILTWDFSILPQQSKARVKKISTKLLCTRVRSEFARLKKFFFFTSTSN